MNIVCLNYSLNKLPHYIPVDTCIQDLKFNSKSTQLALACANFGVRVFDVKTGEVMIA